MTDGENVRGISLPSHVYLSPTSFFRTPVVPRAGRLAHRRRMNMGWLVAMICAVAIPLHAGAVFSPTMDVASHVDIRLESWLESVPSFGFVPVTVRIRNGDSQAHTWVVTSSNGYGMGGGLRADAEMTVEPGRDAERVIYAPVTAHTDRAYYYGALSFAVAGYGVDSSAAGAVTHTSGYGGSRTEFIGMSRVVASKHWSALKDKLDPSGTSGVRSGASRSDLEGSEVDMTAAPEDWRGYSGLAQLWMEEGEWLGMRPAAKAAMLDWVAMGGRVYVLASDGSEARAGQLGLPRKVKDARRYGAGEMVLMAWDGKGMSVDEMAREIRRSDTNGLCSQLGGYDKSWDLRDLAGNLSLKSGLIFGFIAIFGILVGPVNLFWLAPAGKRQRMFWTTPLLSLAGSVLLVAIMILQDGIGGSGARLTLAILQPEQKRLAIMQEQVSRTGVLLRRSFPIAETGWMQPLEMAKSTGFNPLRENRYSYTETDTSREGDWFASRSVQGHLLETVRPSRAAIEWFAAAAGQPPSVLSNIESTLKIVFIVDENHGVWMAQDVGTGEKKPATPSTRAQLDAWLRDGPKKLAGPVLSAAMASLVQQTGCVFAEVTDASKLAVPTLASIRWSEDRAIIAGPFLKR